MTDPTVITIDQNDPEGLNNALAELIKNAQAAAAAEGENPGLLDDISQQAIGPLATLVQQNLQASSAFKAQVQDVFDAMDEQLNLTVTRRASKMTEDIVGIDGNTRDVIQGLVDKYGEQATALVEKYGIEAHKKEGAHGVLGGRRVTIDHATIAGYGLLGSTQGMLHMQEKLMPALNGYLAPLLQLAEIEMIPEELREQVKEYIPLKDFLTVTCQPGEDSNIMGYHFDATAYQKFSEAMSLLGVPAERLPSVDAMVAKIEQLRETHVPELHGDTELMVENTVEGVVNYQPIERYRRDGNIISVHVDTGAYMAYVGSKMDQQIDAMVAAIHEHARNEMPLHPRLARMMPLNAAVTRIETGDEPITVVDFNGPIAKAVASKLLHDGLEAAAQRVDAIEVNNQSILTGQFSVDIDRSQLQADLIRQAANAGDRTIDAMQDAGQLVQAFRQAAPDMMQDTAVFLEFNLSTQALIGTIAAQALDGSLFGQTTQQEAEAGRDTQIE